MTAPRFRPASRDQIGRDQIGRAQAPREQAESLAARLPALLVAAERVAATVAQGLHGRRRVGTGESFWQFRRYQPGDTPAMIDWRQSGKTQPLFVRENEWEAAQSVWLWRDASASMDWRSEPKLPVKRERAEVLLLALAQLLLRGGERVALFESGERPDHGRFALNRLAHHLVHTAGPAQAGSAQADSARTSAAAGLPRRRALPRYAQVVLFGDFLSPLSEVQSRVAGLASAGMRGHLLQVLDPAEELLSFDGRVAFAGMEGEGEVLVPRVEAIRSAYRQRLASHQRGLAELARAVGWSFAVHRTDRPPQTALLALWGALARDAV